VEGIAAGSPPDPGIVELRLLAGFELLRHGSPVDLPLGAQRVLAFLAIEGRPQLRTHVAGVLWPNVPAGRSAASLRSALWRMHRIGRGLVWSSSGRVGLGPHVEVDVHRAVALARQLEDRATPPPPAGTTELLDGDLLPDWFDDWVVPERERLRQVRLHALERLAALLMETGRHAEAIDAAMRAMTSDPLRESAHRALIQVHLVEGNHAEAIRQFEAYRSLVRIELGVEPSPAMMQLIASSPRTGA
jgi:DNA-binding SARP family transcriptional activator